MIWAYSSVDVEYFCTLKYKAPDLSTNGMVEFEKNKVWEGLEPTSAV